MTTTWQTEHTREQMLTKRLAEMFPKQIVIKDDIASQLAGVDAEILTTNPEFPVLKVDFKFGKFFLEKEQKNGTTWCTEEHDPNILVWFLTPEYDECYFLGDLVQALKDTAKQEELGWTTHHTVQSTGTIGYLKSQLGLFVARNLQAKQVKAPLVVDKNKLYRRQN